MILPDIRQTDKESEGEKLHSPPEQKRIPNYKKTFSNRHLCRLSLRFCWRKKDEEDKEGK